MKDATMFERLSEIHFKNDIGMYYCGKRLETPNHTYGPEIRNHYLFVLVNKGTAILHHEKQIKFGERDLLVMLPNERIYYEALDPWSISWLGLYGKTIEEYTELKIVKPNGQFIKKEQLLELQNSVLNKPVEANKIIYIIKNAERLNSSSANSILKFLEEPEDNIIAILLTDNLNLTREDEAHEKNPEKILRNANIDKDGNLIVKRADWTN